MVKQISRLKINTYVLGCLCLGFVFLSGCSMLPEKNAVLSPTPTIKTEPEELFREEPENKLPEHDVSAESPKGYVFQYHDVEMAIDMEAAPILKILGEYQSYFEADSCAGAGIIRTYTYGSFELDTYESEGKEYISCIYFKDDTITTVEGARLFMTEAELFGIYGEDYSIEAGMFVYSKDEMKLKFIVTDHQVTSIQYTSLVTEVKQ